MYHEAVAPDASPNFDLARLFYEMASLLEARDESVFRVRAYQRGAPSGLKLRVFTKCMP